MIQGLTLQELAQTVVRHASGKEDFMAPANAPRYSLGEKNAIRVALGERDFGLTTGAEAQVEDFLGIPRRYATKLAGMAPELLVTNLNGLTERQGVSTRRMIRTLDGNARAFLSDTYKRVDNEEVFDGVYPVLEKLGASIESCNISDDYMHIQAILHRTEGEIRPGDVVKSGFVISNSEVGRGALTVRHLIFRLVCSNGMIRAEDTRRRTHVGGSYLQDDLNWLALSTETQQLKVRAMVAELGEYMEAISTGERFEAALAQIREAADQPIPAEPKVVIESLGARYNLRAAEQDSALLALAESRDYTRWGLANATTWIANDASSYDRGVELEAVGGSIMALGRREYAALAHVDRTQVTVDA